MVLEVEEEELVGGTEARFSESTKWYTYVSLSGGARLKTISQQSVLIRQDDQGNALPHSSQRVGAAAAGFAGNAGQAGLAPNDGSSSKRCLSAAAAVAAGVIQLTSLPHTAAAPKVATTPAEVAAPALGSRQVSIPMSYFATPYCAGAGLRPFERENFKACGVMPLKYINLKEEAGKTVKEEDSITAATATVADDGSTAAERSPRGEDIFVLMALERRKPKRSSDCPGGYYLNFLFMFA
jgi:hypothetical protein